MHIAVAVVVVPTAWFLAGLVEPVQRRLLKWRGPVSAPAVGCALGGGGGAQHVGHRFRHTHRAGCGGNAFSAILNLGLVVFAFSLVNSGSPAKAVR